MAISSIGKMLREGLYENVGSSTVKEPTPADPIEKPSNQIDVTSLQPQKTESTVQTQTPSFSKSDVAFGDVARQRQEQDQSYLQNRNQLLASGFSKKGINDEKSIQDYLSQTKEFSSQSLEDQQNTAREIARLTGKTPETVEQETPTVDTTTQVGQSPTGDTQTTTQADVIEAATRNTIERDQQNFLQDTKRAGTLYDRTIEDLEESDRLFNEKLDREIEQTKTSIERQVDDVILQTNRTVDQYDKVGALKGFTGSGYTQGIMNIRDDAQKTVGRLQSDLNKYLRSTGEAKANAAKQLDTNLARAKENFEYSMRDVMSLASIDVNQLTSQYGLDPDKMANRLDSITLDVLQKQEDLTNTYLTNARTAIQLANDELSTIQAYEAELEADTTKFASNLIETGGSMNEVNELLQSGQLTTDQAQGIFADLIRNTTATLDAQLGGTGLAGQFAGEIQAGIGKGLTPFQVLDGILASDKYQTLKESSKEYKTVNLGNGMMARIDPSTGETVFTEAPIGAREEREQTREDQEFAIELRKIEQQEQMNALKQEAQQIDNEQQKFEFWNDQLKETTDPLARAEIIAQKNGNVSADGTITIPQGKRGHQCGEFVNDALNLPSGGASTRFVNSYEDKLKMDNSSEVSPTIGSALIESTGNQYGHVALINGEGVDENGEYRTLTESNQASSGQVTTDRKVYKDDPNIGGYYTKTQTETSVTDFTPGDIRAYNSLTDSSVLDLKDDPTYQAFEAKRSEVFDDPSSEVSDILRYSRGGKDLNGGEIEELGKFNVVLSQLDSIQEQIEKTNTGPIVGRLSSLNPYDTDSQTLKAQLTSLIPGIARGVYGEVGVLTDNDIRLYAQTIPNLTQTEDVQDAVLAMTLDVVAGSYKKKLQSLGSGGRDVSGYAGIYEDLTNRSNAIRERLGMETGEPQEPIDYFTSGEASVGSTGNENDDAIISLF